jgi:hypothetical protein
VLDSGAWELQAEPLPPDPSGESAPDDLRITMTSPPDQRSGLQVERRFLLPFAGFAFTQVNTFRNVSNRVVKWSIWEVCQVDTASGGEIAVAGPRQAEPVEILRAFGDGSNISWSNNAHRLSVGGTVAKWGFPDASGEIAYRSPDGAGLALSFEVHPDGCYPDVGSRAEVWMQTPLAAPLAEVGNLHPKADYAELEVLSPLHQLAPGQSVSQTLNWRVYA